MRDRYLLLIGALLIVANLVNTQGEYILAERSRRTREQFPARGARGDHRAVLRGVLQRGERGGAGRAGAAGGARAQARRHPPRRCSCCPAVALCGYGAIALLPSLVVVAMAKAAENSFDYSMQTTVEQTLFLPTSSRDQVQGEGDGRHGLRAAGRHGGGRPGAGQPARVLAVAARVRASRNMVLVAVWLAIAVAIARRYRRLAGDKPARRARGSRGRPVRPTAGGRAARAADVSMAGRAQRSIRVVAGAGRFGGGAGAAVAPAAPPHPRGARVPGSAGRLAGARQRGRRRGRRAPTDLGELDSTLIARDDVAGEVDRALALEGAAPGARRERGRRGAVLDLVLPAQPPPRR